MAKKEQILQSQNLYWLLAVLLIILPQLPAQQLYAPDRVQQGQILQSFIYPVKNLESVEFTLHDTKGTVVAQSKGFLLNHARGILAKQLDSRLKDWVNVGLLGIAATQEAGNYTLRASIAGRKLRSQLLEYPIYIQKNEYASQTIKVNEKMDRILNPKDPDLAARQRLQTERLWSVLKRDNPSNLFYSGILLRPLEKKYGRLSSGFGFVRKYVYPGGKIVSRVHRGYDIAAPQGIQVLASGDGLVIMAENRIVTGKTVMLSVLPGVYLKYQHLSTIGVTAGTIVKKGDLIGEVGKTGFSTGNHLHLELWVSSRRVDPSLYFVEPLIDTNQIISMMP